MLFRRVHANVVQVRGSTDLFCMVRGRWLKLRSRAATGAGVNYEEARQKVADFARFVDQYPGDKPQRNLNARYSELATGAGIDRKGWSYDVKPSAQGNLAR